LFSIIATFLNKPQNKYKTFSDSSDFIGHFVFLNFSKYHPELLHVSDISFLKPVNVGSLINMHAHVS